MLLKLSIEFGLDKDEALRYQERLSGLFLYISEGEYSRIYFENNCYNVELAVQGVTRMEGLIKELVEEGILDD